MVQVFGMLIVTVAVIALFWWAVTANQRDRVSAPAEMRAAGLDPAIEIIRARYARGEIGTRDFERLVAGLLRR